MVWLLLECTRLLLRDLGLSYIVKNKIINKGFEEFLIDEYTYTLAIIVCTICTFVLAHGYLIIAFYHILVRETHPLNLQPLLHTDGRVVKFHKVRQSLNNELPIQGMLRNRIVPKPQNFELGAILQAADFKEIRNLVFTQVQLCQVLRVLEVF